VITLMHNAAVLEVNVDTGRLFDGDELYQLTVECLLTAVADTQSGWAPGVSDDG
jgi:hypothetical protein